MGGDEDIFLPQIGRARENRILGMGRHGIWSCREGMG
jgi:hypothetical protein